MKSMNKNQNVLGKKREKEFYDYEADVNLGHLEVGLYNDSYYLDDEDFDTEDEASKLDTNGRTSANRKSLYRAGLKQAEPGSTKH